MGEEDATVTEAAETVTNGAVSPDKAVKDVIEKKEEKKEEVDEMAVDAKDNENGKNNEVEKEDADVSEKAKEEEKVEEVNDNKEEGEQKEEPKSEAMEVDDDKEKQKTKSTSEEKKKSTPETDESSEEQEDDEEKETEEHEDANGAPENSQDEKSENAASEEENVSEPEPESESEEEKSKKRKRVPSKSSSKKESAVKPKAKKVVTPKKTSSSQKKTPSATKSSTSGSKVKEESDTGPKTFSRKKKDVAEEKPVATPKKSAAKEKSGKKSVKDKSKSEKQKLSDDDLRKAICEILKEVDFNTATFTDILKQLAKRFDTELTSRKASIKLMIQEELTKLADEADDEDEEEPEKTDKKASGLIGVACREGVEEDTCVLSVNILGFNFRAASSHEGPPDTRDTKIAALRLKFNDFKSLKGEKVMRTFTRLKCLLNDLENNGVIIPQAEVNATFVNSLPRKLLSINQTQRANNSIKNNSLTTLYGKYNYEEGLIDQIYESETQRFSIQASSSKALIFNTRFQDSDSDVEEDHRTINEFMADLNVEYNERALLANKKRFYKRSERVGSSRKRIEKTNETCFACGKTCHFQKDCPSNKTSTPSYPSSNKSFNKFKSYTPPINQTSSYNTGNYQKDYRGKYKGLKAKMAALTQKIDDLTKEKSKKRKIDKGKGEKGLIVESFVWEEESVSSEDEGTTRIRAFMAIAEDEPSVGKADARRKENNPFNEVLFTKADVSTSEFAPIITSDSEDDSDIQEPLPPLPKLTEADPSSASKSLICLSDLTAYMADLTLNTASKEIKKSSNKVSQTCVIKKRTESKYPAVQNSCPEKNALPLTEQLLYSDGKSKRKIENLNEVWVKGLRSDNETDFRNHKLEEFCDEKDISQNFSSPWTTSESLMKRLMMDSSWVTLQWPRLSGCSTLEDKKWKKQFMLLSVSQTSIEGDAINFNENKSFLDDEFIEPRTKDSQYSVNIEYFPYVSAYEDITLVVLPTLQNSVTSEEPPEFTIGDHPPADHEQDHAESDEILESIEPQDNVLNIWSREKYIELVNIIGEPLAGITTRSRIKDSDAASAPECLYVNFLSEIEPKKLIEALEEEEGIFPTYAAYMGFMVYQMDVKSAFLNGKISEEVYVQQPPRFESSKYPNHVCPDESGVSVNKTLSRDYAGCNLDRKSTSRGCRILGGKLVRWSAKKQSSIAMSSAEAEYVADAGCCAQVLWIKSQLADYDVLYDKVPIFCDNTSAIAISNNPLLHSRTKHIHIKYHFIIDHILKGDIELYFVPTDLQLANIFTKPLAEPCFTRLIAELAKHFEEPEQSLLPPSGEVNADDTADKSLSKASVVILPKKQVTETQHADVTEATADSTKSLASESAEEQENQPSTAEAEKAEKDDEFVSIEEVSEEQSKEIPTIEQLLDEVDKQNKAVQETTENDHASAERLSLPDHMDHICEEVSTLHSRLGDMESLIVQQVSANLKSSLSALITDSLKKQLPYFLSNALKDTLPQLLQDSIKSFVSASIVEELPHIEKELSKSLHNDIKEIYLTKSQKMMTKVRDKRSWCTSPMANNSQHVQDLKLFGTTSLKFSPTPLREPTPPRDPAKGKEVIIVKEQVNELVTYQDEGCSIPKMPKLKPFITLEGTLSQEELNNQIMELKRISDLQAQKDKSKQELRKIADPPPIIKISYTVNSNKEATIKITIGDNLLNLIIHPYFRLKSLGFSEWLEVHALASKKTRKSNDMLLQSLREKFQWVIDQAKKPGLPPPLALVTFRMTAEEKKKKRTEFLKKVFVTEDTKVDGMGKNLIPPSGVVLIEGLVIKEPKSRIFYMNRNTDIAFQRESEFHLTPAVQLICIQNQNKVNSEIASEMFRTMNYVIEARDDCIEARKTVQENLDNLGSIKEILGPIQCPVMKGLSECKASEINVRRIQVKDIIKEVEDNLKTYSSAEAEQAELKGCSQRKARNLTSVYGGINIGLS
nr:hypothetical protein [Tanacetum cinerariifolium]